MTATGERRRRRRRRRRRNLCSLTNTPCRQRKAL